MAKRRSKQDKGAKQDAPLFDYSEAEWSEIEAAARAVLPDGEPLPNEMREVLVDRARLYQSRFRLHPLAKEKQNWRKIARLSERLHQALRVASKRTIECVKVAKSPREAKRTRRWLETYLEKLLEIKDLAEDMSIPPEVTDRRPARVWYQIFVLNIWIGLGGKLRFSRSKRGPQGPLIKFFRAVTSPVMGASAPSLESIPDIVRRQKNYRGRRLIPEVATEEAALQKANGDSR
jgi:hypothetical protein